MNRQSDNNYNYIDWLIRKSLLSALGTLDVCCIRSDEGLTRLTNDESRRKPANEGQYCGFCPPIKSMKLNLLIWRWKRGNISNSHRKGNKPQLNVKSWLWMRKIWLESLISSPFNCKMHWQLLIPLSSLKSVYCRIIYNIFSINIIENTYCILLHLIKLVILSLYY